MNEVISVALVSAHAVVRNGLHGVLSRDPRLHVIATAGNGSETLAVLAQRTVDMAIIDRALPERDCLRLIDLLSRRHRSTRLLVVSRQVDGRHVEQALRRGARGYITTDSAGLELPQAVRLLAVGGYYLSEAAAHALLDELPVGAPWSRIAALFAHMTLRERQVMVEFVAGGSSLDIARRLSLSPDVVDTCRERLMRRLGVSDAAGMLRLAANVGLMAAA